MKKGDIILFVILLAIGIAGCIFWHTFSEEAVYVEVIADGEQLGCYPLSEEREVLIKTGEKGENLLRIQDGNVKMVSANCPNQDCVYHKAIMYENESIVCLPHRVSVVIRSNNDEAAIDAMAY
ncbi:MAG: NusG domain II-containing protein [Lachnospiraceae bacterium]|nr:NusG domain II-containing protein [Lachnospiraceae bacterium]